MGRRGFGSPLPQPTTTANEGPSTRSEGQRIIRACRVQLFEDCISSQPKIYSNQREGITKEIVEIEAFARTTIIDASAACAIEMQQVQVCLYKIDVYVYYDVNAMILPPCKKNNIF